MLITKPERTWKDKLLPNQSSPRFSGRLKSPRILKSASMLSTKQRNIVHERTICVKFFIDLSILSGKI